MKPSVDRVITWVTRIGKRGEVRVVTCEDAVEEAVGTAVTETESLIDTVTTVKMIATRTAEEKEAVPGARTNDARNVEETVMVLSMGEVGRQSKPIVCCT